MKRRRQIGLILLSLGLVFFCGVVSTGYGQIMTTATIAGTVRDTSGAPVPGASVTAANEGTTVQVTTKTNTDGSFVLPGLTVGAYTVRVRKQGFQTFVESGVVLHAAQVATVNATIKVGAITTRVRVVASRVQVQTVTGEISSQVAAAQVGTLPLNGRNYEGLASLMPGVANTSPGNQIGQGGFSTSNVMSINGMGTAGALYSVDGIWNENTGNMNQNSVTPSPDMIQEVRVLQNNYGVQYSLMGANVVLVQTKSGTDQFHGSAYEYFRNDALDARNFFSPTVPALKQNIFGYTLGGPVYIPGHYNIKKNKTFFFWSQQWSRQNIASAIVGASPTAAMRNGTFDTPITNPITGQLFPQTSPGVYQIPQSMLNPNSLVLMNAVEPLPNNVAGGFNNYINLTPQINQQRDDDIKIDQTLGQRFRLMGEYLGEHATQYYPNVQFGTITPFPTNKETVQWPDYLTQLQLTATISPSMVNTASIAMNHRVVSLLISGIVDRSQVPGFNEVLPFNGLDSDHLPIINFSQGYSPIGVTSSLPFHGNSNLDATISDNWSWLRGDHYLLAGVNLYKGLKRQTLQEATNGAWSFTGQFTGNAIADYLLGDAASFTQAANKPRPYMFYPIYSPYVQDTWRATRRLSLTAGLRVLFEPAPHPERGSETFFNPAAFNPTDAPIVNANGTITATPNYNPLNGLAFNGLNGAPLNFTTAHEWFWAPSFGFAWDVFGNGKTALRGGYGITYSRTPTGGDCSYSCAGNPPFNKSITFVTPSFPNPIGAAAKPAGAPSLTTEDPSLQPGQVQTYSLSLEHEFPNNWLASIAGAGNIVRHVGGTWNINQPLPDSPYDFNPVINSGSVYEYTFSPYPGYASIGAFNSGMNAYWDALEIDVRHPVTQGLFLTLAYTWSHGLAEGSASNFFPAGGVQNVYNPGADYGNSLVNVPQVLSISSIWNLPWDRNVGGWKGEVLGGWKYSDITTIQSGFSMTPGLSVSKQGLATRPNATGAGISGPKRVNEWFNTGDFAAPAAGFFGNAGVGSIPGPGLVDFDMAFYKDFHIKERNTIEFRAELFNIFNHTNFSTVQTTFGAGNFGHVTGARDPRIAEFVLRYQF